MSTIDVPKEIIDKLLSLKARQNIVLVAVDGGGASGKSTFAEYLASKLANSIVVDTDNFIKPPKEHIKITDKVPVHSNFDREKLKQQVLKPLKQGQTAEYRPYDWIKDELKPELLKIEPSGYVIVEGLGTLGHELRDFFDYKIWLDCPTNVRRQRGISRDSEKWAKIWDERYIPQDNRYIKEQMPHKIADLVIDTGAANKTGRNRL